MALLSINTLFAVEIKWEYYYNLWIIIIGIFNTWFFLSGIPKDFSSLEEETNYPIGLKIFTINVLLPLLTIYLLILYLYGIKIVFSSHLPLVWVSYMILAFSVFGILSFLLIHPLTNNKENKWVNFYSRLFYFLLLPLVILLLVAISQRISVFGFTENRYFVLLLSIWLGFISLYFILTNGRNIKIIPISLCTISFLSSFGYWGAIDVARRSQLHELTSVLDKHKILANGTVDTSKNHIITDNDKSQIISKIEYLDTHFGFKSMQPLFKEDLSEHLPTPEKNSLTSNSAIICALMKIGTIYNNPLEQTRDIAAAESVATFKEAITERYLQTTGNQMFDINGYDYLNTFNAGSTNWNFSSSKNLLGGDTITLSFNNKYNRIELKYGNLEPLFLKTNDALSKIFSTALDQLPQEKLILEEENAQCKLKIIFTWLHISKKKNAYIIDAAEGVWMVKIKSDNLQKK